MLGHCLAEIWTRQRPEVWQAATVMTKASHSNKFHAQIPNWCSIILTRPHLTDWLIVILVQKRHFALTSLFLVAADAYNRHTVNSSIGLIWCSAFITGPKDNIIQQLFIADQSCTSQFFSRRLSEHFKPWQSPTCYVHDNHLPAMSMTITYLLRPWQSPTCYVHDNHLPATSMTITYLLCPWQSPTCPPLIIHI